MKIVITICFITVILFVIIGLLVLIPSIFEIIADCIEAYDELKKVLKERKRKGGGSNDK